MDKSSVLNKLLWVATAVALVLAVLCGVFAANTEAGFSKVILFVVAFLFLLLTGMLAYLSYIDTFKVLPGKKADKSPLNYFLNVNGKKKRISVDDLTFDIIDKQMNKFIIDGWGTPVALWKNSVFAAGEDVFGTEEVFKILLAYKMISDLQVHHSKKAWKLFFELPDVDFADIQNCLVRNGDEELARALNMYRLTGESSMAEAAEFLDENASYIQRRMINYVSRKIDLFNM